jgi:putative aminopeptidase FrvX
MERRELLNLAKRVLHLPTAPYHEHAVREFVVNYCRELGLRVEVDRARNVIVKCGKRQARSSAPLVFVAHMDHPGFEMVGGNRAEFLGGVPKEMLARGSRVRFYSDSWERPPGRDRAESRPGGRSHIINARIHRLDEAAWPKRKLVTLKFKPGTVNPKRGTFGMWDLPAFQLVGNQLHAVVIDDVLGTTVMLATLAEISRRKLRTQVWCAFTRAEEVGFQGVLALVRGKKIPKDAVVISIEMSKERPWARIGNGPVVRVGDRTTVFDPAATAFLLRAAERCRRHEPGFRAQRCLMDGGSCEATAFAAFGYRAGGLCLPLGNYHNIGKDLRPRLEYVSVNDLEGLLKLAVAACIEWQNPRPTTAGLKKRLLAIVRGAPRQL